MTTIYERDNLCVQVNGLSKHIYLFKGYQMVCKFIAPFGTFFDSLNFSDYSNKDIVCMVRNHVKKNADARIYLGCSGEVPSEKQLAVIIEEFEG